jgi:mannose-6-phosphate isomerase-like protein (cupin superfamily)
VVKFIAPVAFVAVGYLVGSMSSRESVHAQATRGQITQSGQQGFGGGGVNDGAMWPKAELGKAVYWSAEELRKKYVTTDPKAPRVDHLLWTPQYRLTVQRRVHGNAPTTSELHEDKTQVYFIRSGTGIIAIGGTADKQTVPSPGEHRGASLTGAREYRVKEGDVLAIPPFTWHEVRPDPGQTVFYLMMHVESRESMP